MSLTYNIYANDGAGGPVDLSAPIANEAGLSHPVGPLAHPGDWTFLVRTLDGATAFEDPGTDARVRLVLDAAGADVTGRPAAPTGLSATPTAGGGMRVEWAYLPAAGTLLPTGFKVWAAAGAIDYALTPDATTAYDPGRVAYAVDLAGLAGGSTYTIAVRATNAAGDETNTATAEAVADAAGPGAVDGLDGMATY